MSILGQKWVKRRRLSRESREPLETRSHFIRFLPKVHPLVTSSLAEPSTMRVCPVTTERRTQSRPTSNDHTPDLHRHEEEGTRLTGLVFVVAGFLLMVLAAWDAGWVGG